MSEILEYTAFGKTNTLEDRGDHYLEIHDYGLDKYRAPRKYFYRFPKEAKVVLHESMEDWGGIKGKTKFVYTEPAGAYTWERDGHVEPWTEISRFTSASHNIFPDGTYYPPEMVQNLQWAEEVLGYQIDPSVWEALGMTGQGMNQVTT